LKVSKRRVEIKDRNILFISNTTLVTTYT